MTIEHKVDDIYAWQVLSPLVVGYPYLPFSGSAVRPILLAHLLNDIVVNRRRRILELGAGISTILMARLIVRNKLDAKVTSIEHDAGWVSAVTELLAGEGLSDVVDIVHAPLVACEDALENNLWYDRTTLASRVTGEFDLALVDGPPAWEQGKGLARYPAGPFLEAHLGERCAIYLDDVERLGERLVMGKWNARARWGLKVQHGSFAYAARGPAYFTEPFSYLR
ncbi:MAG TPA: class I SAM-dependent methyltransferase [Kofleriaceae bacterium]